MHVRLNLLIWWRKLALEFSLRFFCSFHFEMCMIIVVDLRLLFERISLNDVRLNLLIW